MDKHGGGYLRNHSLEALSVTDMVIDTGFPVMDVHSVTEVTSSQSPVPWYSEIPMHVSYRVSQTCIRMVDAVARGVDKTNKRHLKGRLSTIVML